MAGEGPSDEGNAGEALRESEERYRALVELVPEPIIVQAQRKLVYVNPAAVIAFGASAPSELIGRQVSDFIHPEYAPAIDARIERVLAGQPVTFMEQRFLRLDGSIGDAEVASIPLTFEGKPAVLTVARDISARRAAERERLQALRQREEAEAARRASERRVHAQFKAIPVPTYAWQRVEGGAGEDFVLVDYNDAAMRMTGGGIASFLGKTLNDMYDPGSEVSADIARTLREGISWPREMEYTSRSTSQPKKMSVRYIAVPPDLVLVYTEDISQRMAFEEQLRQTEKMEAVGRLAAGVAHDFNNLLMVIQSYGESLAESLGAGPLADDVEEIRRAAARAASLTRQLLAFSRTQVMQPRSVDLNAVVRGLEPMIRRIIGEDIRVELKTASGLGRIRADPGQLEQVIMNLAVNARDAMPSGGTLMLETSDVHIAESLAGPIAPGSYVRLSVRDSGLGMDAATSSRAFEPFFTTKGQGGTGLGLATVYGVVQQSGGAVRVDTAPGQGATFEIYLPHQRGPSATPSRLPAAGRPRRGTGVILLVEDEGAVRSITRRMLEGVGYTVLEAYDGGDALRVVAGFPGRIDLLVTDVVMPEMGGRPLYARLQATRPDLRVVYVSGYTDDDILRRGDLPPGCAFLQKPFSASALVQIVAETMGGARPEDLKDP